MIRLEKQEFIVPAWIEPMIVNGDLSGLIDSEIRRVEEFEQEIQDHKPEGTETTIIYFSDEEPFFQWSHYFGKYGTNCITCFVEYLGKEK